MKKKMFWIFIIALIVLYVPNVLAVRVTGCDAVMPGADIDTKITNTVHTLIVIIKIVVPVLLVVFGMLDLMKGLTAQKDDEIKKGQQILIKRLISAALVFFVISIVQLLISFVADATEKEGIMSCANCFLNGANSKTGVCN